ncbi:MAG: hypothetical protein FH756_13935 [Firmicutes bacterium]|nr:hypothetical protein [Bacillota bacterium]
MKYRIIIELLSDEEEQLLYKGKSCYSDVGHDDVYISTRKIEILIIRNGNKRLLNFLTNCNSTVYQQITKCISFAYAVTDRDISIEKITIQKYHNEKLIKNYEEKQEINQPIDFKSFKDRHFIGKDLEPMFVDFTKAKTVTIALTFLLKGLYESTEGNKFENYWKSFNNLYSYMSGEDKENKKLYFMRRLIESNKCKFNLTLKIIDSHEALDIRKLRLREMVLNDFPGPNNTVAFKEFILRYKDKRLNQIFSEILPYRKDLLKNENLYTIVESHINQHKNGGIKNNNDLLCFYILKYSYFIRNKYFHAEKLSPSFNLVKNNEIKELSFLNEVFELFLKDLIACNCSL